MAIVQRQQDSQETPSPKLTFWTQILFYFGYYIRHITVNRVFNGVKPNIIEKKIYNYCKSNFLHETSYSIPRYKLNEITSDEFKKNFVKQNKPVVLEGFSENSEAVKSWTFDYFKENYGDQQVLVRVNGKSMSLINRKCQFMSITELIDNIKASGNYTASNIETLFNKNSQLRQQVNLALLEEYLCVHKKIPIFSTQLFLGGKGIRTNFHCEPSINGYLQIRGEKKWTLIHPRHSPLLQPEFRNDLLYASSYADENLSDQENSKRGYVLYKYAPKFETILKPGDMLLSPNWWWHAVETLSDSISVACRTIYSPFKGNKAFSIPAFFSPVSLKHNINLLATGWGADDTNGAISILKNKN